MLPGLSRECGKLVVAHLWHGHRGHEEWPGEENERRERQVLAAHQVRGGGRPHHRLAVPVECEHELARCQQHHRINDDDQSRDTPEPETRARDRFQHQAAVRLPNSRLTTPPISAAAPAKISTPNLPITLKRPALAAAAAAPPTMRPVRPYSAILSPGRYSA